MTAFGNNEKDDLYESIKDFVANKKKDNPDIQINEIIEEVMEVFSYALKSAIYSIENFKE